MEASKKNSPVGTWLFLFSAFFAAGLLVLMARPVVDRIFSKVAECECDKFQIPVRVNADEVEG